MRLLLDTHVVLWQLGDDRRIRPEAERVIAEASELAFSVVSFAEIGVKAAIGKLLVPEDLRRHVLESGLRVLSLSADHGLGVARLPVHHRDPYDRLLIAQAVAEGLTIVTGDPRFAAYDVSVIDA